MGHHGSISPSFFNDDYAAGFTPSDELSIFVLLDYTICFFRFTNTMHRIISHIALLTQTTHLASFAIVSRFFQNAPEVLLSLRCTAAGEDTRSSSLAVQLCAITAAVQVGPVRRFLDKEEHFSSSRT